MTAPVLAACDLSVALGGRPVLRAVTAAVRAGEVTALLGPNGAGKTTLLRTLAGLLRPGDGSARFRGAPVAGLPAAERARRLAFLPQESQAHWPLRVRDVVALGRLPFQAKGFRSDRAADAEAVERTLAAGGLLHLAERRVTELSGGELRRVLLARALAGAPEALLADEPTSGLDPGAQLDVMAALGRAAAAGAAVLAATHDLGLAARFADRILLLYDGTLAAAGPPDAVLTAETLERVYGVRVASRTAFTIGPLERVDERGDVAGD